MASRRRSNVTYLIVLADTSLEINDSPASLVQPLALTFHQLFSLLCIAVEEPRLNFRLFVFKRDIARHDVTVVEHLRHVRVPATVVQNQSIDEPRVCSHIFLHGHGLHSIQVEWFVWDIDALDGIHHSRRELFCQFRVELGAQGGAGHAFQQFAVLDHVQLRDLEVIEELDDGVASNVETIHQDAGMQAFGSVAFGLSHEFSAEQDRRGGSISSDIIL